MNINPNVNAKKYQSSYKNLREYILMNLGYPLVRVELTNEMLTSCIIEALTYFTKYAGYIEYKLLVVHPTGSGNFIDIPDDPDYEVEEVDSHDFDPFSGIDPTPNVLSKPKKLKHEAIIDVIFSNRTMDRMARALLTGGLVGGFQDYALPLTNEMGRGDFISNFDITNYFLYASKIEDFKKVLGIEQSWELLNDKIYLYPAEFRWSDPIGIIYKPAVTEEYAESEQWIKEYALAKAKMMLGTVRGKLSGYNAAGINIAADAEQLKSEGKEDRDKLLEDLKLMGVPMPMFQF